MGLHTKNASRYYACHLCTDCDSQERDRSVNRRDVKGEAVAVGQTTVRKRRVRHLRRSGGHVPSHHVRAGRAGGCSFLDVECDRSSTKDVRLNLGRSPRPLDDSKRDCRHARRGDRDVLDTTTRRTGWTRRPSRTSRAGGTAGTSRASYSAGRSGRPGCPGRSGRACRTSDRRGRSRGTCRPRRTSNCRIRTCRASWSCRAVTTRTSSRACSTARASRTSRTSTRGPRRACRSVIAVCSSRAGRTGRTGHCRVRSCRASRARTTRGTRSPCWTSRSRSPRRSAGTSRPRRPSVSSIALTSGRSRCSNPCRASRPSVSCRTGRSRRPSRTRGARGSDNSRNPKRRDGIRRCGRALVDEVDVTPSIGVLDVQFDHDSVRGLDGEVGNLRDVEGDLGNARIIEPRTSRRSDKVLGRVEFVLVNLGDERARVGTDVAKQLERPQAGRNNRHRRDTSESNVPVD